MHVCLKLWEGLSSECHDHLAKPLKPGLYPQSISSTCLGSCINREVSFFSWTWSCFTVIGLLTNFFSPIFETVVFNFFSLIFLLISLLYLWPSDFSSQNVYQYTHLFVIAILLLYGSFLSTQQRWEKNLWFWKETVWVFWMNLSSFWSLILSCKNFTNACP
jgi:hypothetical protein